MSNNSLPFVTFFFISNGQENRMMEAVRETETLDLVCGAEAIAAALGLPTRKVFHMLENKYLPAKKVGNRWVADRGELREFFKSVAA